MERKKRRRSRRSRRRRRRKHNGMAHVAVVSQEVLWSGQLFTYTFIKQRIALPNDMGGRRLGRLRGQNMNWREKRRSRSRRRRKISVWFSSPLKTSLTLRSGYGVRHITGWRV